jgi:hypothetical protein
MADVASQVPSLLLSEFHPEKRSGSKVVLRCWRPGSDSAFIRTIDTGALEPPERRALAQVLQNCCMGASPVSTSDNLTRFEITVLGAVTLQFTSAHATNDPAVAALISFAISHGNKMH